MCITIHHICTHMLTQAIHNYSTTQPWMPKHKSNTRCALICSQISTSSVFGEGHMWCAFTILDRTVAHITYWLIMLCMLGVRVYVLNYTHKLDAVAATRVSLAHKHLVQSLERQWEL